MDRPRRQALFGAERETDRSRYPEASDVRAAIHHEEAQGQVQTEGLAALAAGLHFTDCSDSRSHVVLLFSGRLQQAALYFSVSGYES